MKNIIKTIKNILLNNKGAVTQNIVRGLGAAAFSSVVLYGVYTSYNNSPAYNPEKRAPFVAQEANYSVNAINYDNPEFRVDNTAPQGIRTQYGYGQNSERAVQRQLNKNATEFENTRSYWENQEGSAGGQFVGGGAGPTAEAYKMAALDDPNLMLAANDDNAAGNPDISNGSRGGGGSAQAMAALEGAVAEGAGRGVKSGSGVRQSPTNVNRLAGSGKSGSSFSNSTGGSSSVGGSLSSTGGSSGSRGGSDNGNTQAGPRPENSPEGAGGKGGKNFTSGRVAQGGGYNVSNGVGTGNDGKGGNGGGQGARSAVSDLLTAHKFSSKAVQAIGNNSDEVAANAAAAFDGSKPDEGGSTIEGDLVKTDSLRGLGKQVSSYAGLGDFLDGFEGDIETDSQKVDRLESYRSMHLTYALIAALSAAILISILRQSNNVWSWIGVAIVAAVALYAIWGMDYDGNGNSIFQDLNDLDDIYDKYSAKGESIGDHDSSRKGLFILEMAGLTGLIGAACIWGGQLANWASKQLGQIWNWIGSFAGNKLSSSISGMYNDIKNKF